jgi:membrane fusion protein, multidrug efflux system
VRLEKSVLTAPFAARIGARMADPGQTAAAGQTVLVLFRCRARPRPGRPAAGTGGGLAVGDA